MLITRGQKTDVLCTKPATLRGGRLWLVSLIISRGEQNWFQAVRCKVHIIIRTQLNEQIAITTADTGQSRGAERENTNGEFVSPARKPGPIIWDIFSSGGCQKDNFHGRQIQ